MKPIRSGESNDAGMFEAIRTIALPRWLKRLYVWYQRYIKRDEIYAGLIEGWHKKTIAEYWPLIAQREDYRRRWFEMWQKEKLDYVLTVPNSLPAVPHDGMKHGFKTLGYTLMFNLVSLFIYLVYLGLIVCIQLDYTSGVLPVTHVDAIPDMLPSTFKPRNAVEKLAYNMYDSVAMHGLPVGVQVIGQRLQEEHVLEGMRMVESALKNADLQYKLLQT